jgi:hypothetical protein
MKTTAPTILRVRTFILCWLLAALLLYPLVVAPIIAAYRLVVDQVPLDQLMEHLWEAVQWGFWSAWHHEPDLLAVLLGGFTLAMALVQNALFIRLLQVRLPHWIPLTIAGGGVGIAAMIALNLPEPFYVLPWFALLGAAQAYSLRRLTAQWWLWIIAHAALSLLFPLVGSGLALLAKWCIALLIYAVTLLMVMERLALHARTDKLKPTES